MKPSLIQLLRSNSFAIYIAIASVLVQSFHSFYAFYKISSLNGSYWGIAQAALFALIVDCAVLFYTVRKNTKVTWMFAFVMVLINLYVYYTHLGLTFDFILGILISFVIPVSNYFYSEEIDDVKADESKADALLVKQRDSILERLKESELELSSEKEKATKYITELREEIKKRDALIVQYSAKPMPDYSKGTDRETKPEMIDDHSMDALPYLKGPAITKGFASLKSPAQEETPPRDKSILNVEKIIATDRPNP